MANVKISALPAATTPLAGTEVLPIVQSGTTVKVSVADLTLGRAITASNVTDSALTSGRVTYATTGGLLTDSVSLTFNGTILSTPTLNLTNALGLAYGGTGQITANASFNALAPSQTGNSGKYLTTDGTNTFWATNPLGTVTSVSTGTGLTGGPITTSGTISFSNTNVGTWAATPSSANLAAAMTDETGTGSLVFNTNPTFIGPFLGTPSSGSLLYCTDYPTSALNGTINLATQVSGTLAVNKGGTGITTLTTGYIPFGAGTTSFNSSSNLFWDNTNTRLGIGTSSPQYALDISSGSTVSSRLLASGSSTDAKSIYTSLGPTGTTVTLWAGTFGSQSAGVITTLTNHPLIFGTFNQTNTMTFGTSGILTVPTLNLTNALGAAYGGTGATTLTGYVYGNGTGAMTASTTIPTSSLSGTINLATQVTGTLPVGNGGTGLSTLTAGYIPYGNGTSAFSSSANLTFSGSTLSVSGTASVLNLTGSSYSQVVSATSLYIDAGSTGAVYIRPNGSTQSAVFSATGYLGIGTTSPNRLLTVQATGTGNVANFQSNAGPNIAFTGTETSGRTYLIGEGLVTAGNFSIYDSTASAERFVVNSSGNVLIGTTSSPFPKLYVSDGTVGVGLGPYATGSVAYAGTWTNHSLAFVTNGAEVGRFDTSGNLGLAIIPSTWSQGKAFEFFNSGYGLWNGGSSTYVTANMYFNGGFKYANTGSQASNYYQYQGQHVWNIAPSGTAGGTITFTQAMTLDNSGNLLLNTTSQIGSGKFSVYFVPGTSQGINFKQSTDTSSPTPMQFFNASGTLIGSVTTTSSATAFNTSSDQRLKENIVDAPSGNIDDIKVRSFDWKSDGSHQEYGMVAQELLEVAPYAVHQPQDTEEMMAVDYSKLVPMMIKEIQDLKQRIATLENK